MILCIIISSFHNYFKRFYKIHYNYFIGYSIHTFRHSAISIIFYNNLTINCTDYGIFLRKLKKTEKNLLKPLAKSKKVCYNILRCLFNAILQEVLEMAKCDICGKGVSFGIKVSHSHRRSNRTWKPNIMKVKAIVNGSPKSVHVCTRCLRSGKVQRAV